MTVTRSLSFSIGLYIIIFASGQAVNAQAKPRRPASSASATVHGTVLDCYPGKPPTHVGSGLLVLALRMGESAKIRDIINKIEQYEATHPLGYNDLPGTPFDDQFSAEVEALRPHVKKARTDNEGKYRFADLRAGERYLVLAVNPEEENEIFYMYQLTPELTPGEQAIDINKRGCNAPAKN